MVPDRPTLGRCPECGAEIPRPRLLIEYDTADGRPARFASCPACEDVVHPRAPDDDATVAGS